MHDESWHASQPLFSHSNLWIDEAVPSESALKIFAELNLKTNKNGSPSRCIIFATGHHVYVCMCTHAHTLIH